MTDFARTGIFAALLFASACRSVGTVKPSSPMPPTFSKWRRETRLSFSPQQANAFDGFILAPQDEFFGIQKRPGQILEDNPPAFGAIQQRSRLLQLRVVRAAAQCGPIEPFDQFAVRLAGIQKRR